VQESQLPIEIESCRVAIKCEPARSDLHVKLGALLQQSGDLQGAVQCFKHAIEIDPDSFAAYNNLGGLFASLRDWPTALTFLRAAIAIRPGIADIHNNLGNVYFEQEQNGLSIESYQRAVFLQPELATYRNNLGNVLRTEERYAEAEMCFRQALTLRPDYAEAHVNLGFACFVQGRMEEAELHNRSALEIKPDLALAHCNLAQILLRRGEFAEGWREHEWRWQWKDFPSPRRIFLQPQWDGRDITGSSVFIHAEQGFGDTIQFLRYVPLLAERGARVVLEVHPELLRLSARVAGVAKLIARGEAIPECDWHCPMMSLPLAFATSLASIPVNSPYLHASVETPPWIDIRNHQPRVGLVWAGSKKNRIDGKRSLSLLEFAPLFGVSGISFYSLQQGSLADDDLRPFAGVLPSTADFAETAAAIAHLDLIVAVDTSVAHLAGALGKPVWILLPYVADWRWLTDRADSPWYPSARLFRQHQPGAWHPVIDQVAAALAHWIKPGGLA
jgi:Tfp pilus assembly protein PilF